MGLFVSLGPFYSAITYGQSEDGYEIEYAAPYVGFMKDVKGEPVSKLTLIPFLWLTDSPGG